MAVDLSYNLVKPLEYLFTFSLGMGDSFSDVANWYAERAGINCEQYIERDEEEDEEDDYYDGEYDYDKIFHDSLEILASKHEQGIIDDLMILFDGDMLDWVLEELKEDPQMAKAIRAVYRYIGDWPDGPKVRKAIEDNIFPHLDK